MTKSPSQTFTMPPLDYSRLESFQHATAAETSSSLNLLSLIDDTPGTIQRGQPANDALLHVLELEVNHPMGEPPDWAPARMQNPDPRYQCASTASNIYREAMLAANVIDSIDSTEHRELIQTLVPKWITAMGELAEEIPADQIRPGDVVVGLGGIEGQPQNNDRHIGFVGEFDPQTQEFAAYSNAMGTLTLQDLDERFGPYREEHYYRLYFPE